MDEVVSESSLRHVDGPTRLLNGLFVPGGDRTRKFLQREERERTGHVDIRLCVTHQTNRARRIETVEIAEPGSAKK
jgi:hypothetical protein